MKQQFNNSSESAEKNKFIPEWKDFSLTDFLDSNRLKTTPLHHWHIQSGANMADFGGYHMPLWYEAGVKQEHLAILNSCGIFDTSHMACITVKGKNAFELLQFCFTRDLSGMKASRCVYGAFLNEKGFCIDDAIIYKFSGTVYMICVNSGMGGVITDHLVTHKNNLSVEINDLTGRISKIDIQGKNSARVLSAVLKNPDAIFKNMPYFSFKNVELLDGTNILLSRSGYTGEFGFELFITPYAVVKLWKDILIAGEKYNIIPCGLGSRDSLRAGAVLPLSHQDIGNWLFINHPWEFALPFDKNRNKFTKDFLGLNSLLKNADEYIYPFAGDNLRKIGHSKNSSVLDGNKKEIGTILTCATDIGIDWHDKVIVSVASDSLPTDLKIKGLSCGFIKVNKKLDYGTKLTLKEGKRQIKVTVLPDIRPERTARLPITNFYN